MIAFLFTSLAIAGPRLMVRAKDSASYTTAKAAAEGGSVLGVSVTLLADNAARRLLYIEVADNAARATIQGSVDQRVDRAYQVVFALNEPMTLGEAFALDPVLASEAYLLGVSTCE